MNRSAVRVLFVCLVACLLASSTPRAISSGVVISQVYGGGGNSGATLKNDFIELFNRGSAPVTIDGWSVQYASSTGSSWQRTNLTGTIPAGGYYLVQQAQGAGGTVSLPAPDAIGTIPMSANSGKVALVSNDVTLTGTCPSAGVVDFVGFGSANCSETLPTITLSNTTAARRAQFGCKETDNNNADFSVGAPAPRNSATPLRPCDVTPALSVADVSIAEGDAGTTTAVFTVTLSTAAPAGGVTFDIATADGTATAGLDYVARALTGQTIAAGQTTYTFNVTVNADLDIEPSETFFVNVTSASGATVADGQATGTIVNDDVVVVPIHEIQGSGTQTPYLGQLLRTTGIVTARKSNGFFLQTREADADADPATSQGVFVFTGAAPAVGDAVAVTGTATEFFELTEIQASAVIVTSTMNPLPAPVTLTTSILNGATSDVDLEKLEGMRLYAASLTSVAPSNSFGEILTVLTGVGRPMREPGIPASAPLPPAAEGGFDCCVPRWDENRERLMIDSDGVIGSTAIHATSNVTFSDVTGPLDYTFGAFKLLPETAPLRTPNMSAVPAPAPAANEFTVAGYNIEHFRSANATQLAKAALTIRTVLRSPDIIGAVEIFDLASLQALADRVNADAVAAGEANPGYEAHLIPAADGTQHVGFLVRTPRVAIQTVTQELAGEVFELNGDLLHDRPPLVLRATVIGDGTHTGPVIVLVNHTRSFIDVESTGAEGARVRAKRTAQAESIAALLQQLQTGNPGTPVISVGDYNAFQFSDGYTDPIAVLKGTPTPGDRIVAAQSPDLVNPDFVNLTDTLLTDQQYSFMFEGTPQALDHVLVNSAAAGYLQRYAVARVNADYPNYAAAGFVNNITRPEGHSDHDATIAYFAFPGTPVVTLNGGAMMTVEAFGTFTDPGATAHDGGGALAVTVSGSVDMQTPGDYTLRYTASNISGTTTVERIVHVVDTAAPAISTVTLTPSLLGPPDHKLVTVTAFYDVSDASGTAACTLSVTSNESLNATGDGNTTADYVVVDAHQVQLRAERSGRGSGRYYAVKVACTDASGNTSTATATAVVPK